MTELVASVRLKADGSGLVGQANAASAAVAGVGKAAATAGAEARTLATGTAAAGAAVSALETELRQARTDAAAFQAELRQAQQASADLAGRVDVLETRLKKSGRAHRDAAGDAERHAFGLRNLGQQFGDLGVSIQGGVSPARAFGQQAGQIGYALSEMGGKAGKVGAFLTGPWGIALTIAAAAAAPYIEKLFEAGTAADEQREKLEQAATAADSYGNAQSLLGKIVDLSTGKIKTQNVALQQSIKLLAQSNLLDAQKRQRTATETVQGLGDPTFGERAGVGYAGIGSTTAGSANIAGGQQAAAALAARLAPLRTVVQDYVKLTQIPGASQAALDKGLDATILRLDKLGRTGKLAGRDLIDAKAAVLELATAINDQRANQQVVDVANGGPLPDTLRQARGGRTPRTPRPSTRSADAPSTAGRDEFGRDAADRLAGLTERFDQTASVLGKTNAELRQIDDLIDDLSRKKPPGFEGLIASAEAAKVTIRRGLIDGVAEAFDKPRTLADQATVAFGQLDAIAADLEKRRPPDLAALLADVDRARGAIRDGLNRPFDEYVEAQEQSLQIGQLIAAGRTAEADALRTIVQLERQMGPLTEEQKASVLATTQALAAQERQVERLHRRQQVYLNALGDVQGLVAQTIYEGPKGLASLPGRLADIFKRFAAEKLTESLFGDVFDKLRDQVKGTDTVEDASLRMADAVDTVTSHTGQATAALDAFARSARGAAQAVAAAPAGGFGVTRDAAGGIASDLLTTGDEIVRRSERDEDIVIFGRGKPRDSKIDPFASSIGQIAAVLGKKIGIDDAKAEKIGGFVGGAASKGLRGAVEGQAAASVAGLLGIKTSSTGSSIGGAIGGLTGLPGGSIIGGLLGGVVGGLFGGKPKEYGSSTISFADGAATAGTAIGKGSAEREAASALGGSVAAGLNQIASALGAELGSANVSIGYRPGHKDPAYRVDTTGRGRVTGVEAFKTEAEAVAFAIRDAITDGAIKGISPAVAAALQSSADVDKAVAEAVKVQQLETLLGGVSAQLGSVFKQFDAEAAERVRLAKKYGLDLLQVEKVNAEQRADLLDQTLSARVASLKNLQASLTIGDLFEGTAAERRTGILKAIDEAKADSAAGDEGANDRVAQLLGELVTTTKTSFGTAGPELTADRALAASEAARLIKIEEDRVRAAAGQQAATTKAVEAVGVLTDESNDLLASNNQILTQVRDLLAGMGGGGGIAADRSLVAYEAY